MASKETIPSTEHLPWCVHCKAFVEPQVVGSTRVTGGRTLIAPNGLGLTQVSSDTDYRKFCRICGTEVFSQLDINAAEAERKARAQNGLTFIILCAAFLVIVLGILFAIGGFR